MAELGSGLREPGFSAHDSWVKKVTISSNIELIVFMQGFSQHEGKPEIHAFHDPGGEKEPKSNKQWEMSQSLFVLVIYFVRAICSMNEQIKGELFVTSLCQFDIS